MTRPHRDNPRWKSVQIAPGHWRTFQVWYENEVGSGATRSFRSQQEAEEFVERWPALSWWRIRQVDEITLKEAPDGETGSTTV